MSADHKIDGFRCPLRAACFFRVEASTFDTKSEAHAAVEEYQACQCPTVKAGQAEVLYIRHLLLMRKVLGGFCPQSACYPGACLPEELFGETFPIFLKILDEYRPSFGLDFLGYASQRVRFGLQNRARGSRRADNRSAEEALDAEDLQLDMEGRILDRVLVDELLSGLSLDDADLLRLKYAFGHSTKELSERFGLSSAALRKRCERARKYLRDSDVGPEDTACAAEA